MYITFAMLRTCNLQWRTRISDLSRAFSHWWPSRRCTRWSGLTAVGRHASSSAPRESCRCRPTVSSETLWRQAIWSRHTACLSGELTAEVGGQWAINYQYSSGGLGLREGCVRPVWPNKAEGLFCRFWYACAKPCDFILKAVLILKRWLFITMAPTVFNRQSLNISNQSSTVNHHINRPSSIMTNGRTVAIERSPSSSSKRRAVNVSVVRIYCSTFADFYVCTCHRCPVSGIFYGSFPDMWRLDEINRKYKRTCFPAFYDYSRLSRRR